MSTFDIRNKLDYPFVRGIEIAYLDGNYEHQTGIVKGQDSFSIELMSGVVVNKSNVFDVLSKESEQEVEDGFKIP